MQAIDVMTKKLVTASADTSVEEVAKLLLKHHVSAVPIVGQNDELLGLVSEGDLIRRIVDSDEPRRSWWLELISGQGAVEDFIKTHGRHAKDVMTRNITTISPQTEVAQIAKLLARKRLKRVPVVEGGRLVGMVSRSDLLQGLITAPPGKTTPVADDRLLRERVLEALAEVPGIAVSLVNVTVAGGQVRIWGAVNSDFEEKAIRVAAENVEGVREVETQMGRIPAWSYGI